MEYTIDELLEKRKNILQELDDSWDGGMQLGCCCCGDDSDMQYEQELLDELNDVEAELALHGVNF